MFTIYRPIMASGSGPSVYLFVFFVCDKNSNHDCVNFQNSNKTYFKMMCEL